MNIYIGMSFAFYEEFYEQKNQFFLLSKADVFSVAYCTMGVSDVVHFQYRTRVQELPISSPNAQAIERMFTAHRRVKQELHLHFEKCDYAASYCATFNCKYRTNRTDIRHLLACTPTLHIHFLFLFVFCFSAF